MRWLNGKRKNRRCGAGKAGTEIVRHVGRLGMVRCDVVGRGMVWCVVCGIISLCTARTLFFRVCRTLVLTAYDVALCVERSVLALCW